MILVIYVYVFYTDNSVDCSYQHGDQTTHKNTYLILDVFLIVGAFIIFITVIFIVAIVVFFIIY